ncbi:Lar family restriction alleviation protein [Cupriavidus necator]|uniref:Lar family restriction alleviation protein n=1 Tax=Cupriavidus necator TaxID=106590 RepID=UPI00339D99E1
MATKDLMPCPFCGKHVASLQYDVDAYPDAETLGWYVDCDNETADGCGAIGPTARTQEEAIAAWNTRATATQFKG